MRNFMKPCLSILIFLCFVPAIFGSHNYEVVPLGDMEKTDVVLWYQDRSYPLAYMDEQFWMALGTLEQLPVALEQKEGIYYVTLAKEAVGDVVCYPILQKEKVCVSPYPIYCGNVRSLMVMSASAYYVPVSALNGLWDVVANKTYYEAKDKLEDPLYHLKMDEKGITSYADYWMRLNCKHLFWNGTDYEATEEEVVLGPRASALWQNQSGKLYVGTTVSRINELDVIGKQDAIYNEQKRCYQAYHEAQVLGELERMFPPYIIKAQLKCNIGSLKEKEIVTLWSAQKRYYCWVKNVRGEKQQVPYGCLHIIGESGAKLPKVNKEHIEAFANLSGMTSMTDYLVWTDLYRQKTYVLQREGDKWQFVQSFVCSTGKNTCPTPSGIFEVQYAIPFIGIEKGYRCKNALVFYQDYMFHSILFDKTGKYIKSGQYELGSRASHGCVRLSEKDSAWLYQHIPVKTTVWIR